MNLYRLKVDVSFEYQSGGDGVRRVVETLAGWSVARCIEAATEAAPGTALAFVEQWRARHGATPRPAHFFGYSRFERVVEIREVGYVHIPPQTVKVTIQ